MSLCVTTTVSFQTNALSRIMRKQPRPYAADSPTHDRLTCTGRLLCWGWCRWHLNVQEKCDDDDTVTTRVNWGGVGNPIDEDIDEVREPWNEAGFNPATYPLNARWSRRPHDRSTMAFLHKDGLEIVSSDISMILYDLIDSYKDFVAGIWSTITQFDTARALSGRINASITTNEPIWTTT